MGADGWGFLTGLWSDIKDYRQAEDNRELEAEKAKIKAQSETAAAVRAAELQSQTTKSVAIIGAGVLIVGGIIYAITK